MYNPNFNSPEFEGIKNEVGLNRFILSVKQWVEKLNKIAIQQMKVLENFDDRKFITLSETENR